MEFLGPLISAGANLFGGIFGSNKAAEQAELNRQMQLQFAQNAIQWKVADAQKAGVHPLFALGASTSSYTPVSNNAGEILGDSIGKMGQDVGRAFAAGGTKAERQLQLAGAQIDIEGKQLDNDIKRMELASKAARLNQPATGPGVPEAGVPFMPEAWGQGAKPFAAYPGLTEFDKNDKPELTASGFTYSKNPTWSNQQDFEDRYGDSADLLAPFIADADAYRATGKYLPQLLYEYADRTARENLNPILRELINEIIGRLNRAREQTPTVMRR